jgi:pheromone shutdown protein TraB
MNARGPALAGGQGGAAARATAAPAVPAASTASAAATARLPPAARSDRAPRRAVVAAAAAATAAAAPRAATTPALPPASPLPPPIRTLDALPADLRRMVAAVELPPSDNNNNNNTQPPTKILILGVSSTSRRSADQARALVRLAQPDAVVLSLCRERAGSLIDPDSGDATANATQATAKWHCRRVRFDGLPVPDERAAEEASAAAKARLPADYKGPSPPPPPVVASFPRPEDLLRLVRTRPGVPVGVADIEEDVRTLLSTGLFARARPFCESGGVADAPMFAAVGKKRESDKGAGEQQQHSEAAVALRFVPPLAGTRFIVAPRALPAIKSMAVRVDSSAQQRAGEIFDVEARLETVGEAARRACRGGTDDRASLGAYMTARAALLEMFNGSSGGSSDDYVVTFSPAGVEQGRPEALVRRRRPPPFDPPFVSGLEGTAAGGEGLGIEPFKPVRQGLKLSRRMTLPPVAAQRVIAEAAAAAAAVAAAGEQQGEAAAAAAAAAADKKEWSPATAPPRGSPVPNWRPTVPTREWPLEQADDASMLSQQAEVVVASGPGGRTPVAGAPATVAALLSGAHGALVSRAAATTGVGRSATWRAALDAATEVGARAVVLADRPQSATQRRLAETVAQGEGAAVARLAAAAAGVLAGIVGAATHVASSFVAAGGGGGAADALASSSLPLSSPAAAADAAVLAVGFAAASAALAPILSPLFDAYRFSRLASADDIEREVSLDNNAAGSPPSSITSNLNDRLILGAEDALLRWPGAWRSLVDERDAFLAAVTAAAAAGADCGAPAFVADLVDVVDGVYGGGAGGSAGAEAVLPLEDPQRRQSKQQLAWRFMAGARAGGQALSEGGADAAAGRASLPGRGDGEYRWSGAQDRPRCVVAIVGASHVRGIVRRWEWASGLVVGEGGGEGAGAGGGEAVERALASLLIGDDAEAEAVARAGDTVIRSGGGRA